MHRLSILLTLLILAGGMTACDDNDDIRPVGSAELLYTIAEAGNRVDVSPDGTMIVTTQADERNIPDFDKVLLPRLWRLSDASHLRDLKLSRPTGVRDEDFLYARFHPMGTVIGRGAYTPFRSYRRHVLTEWNPQTGEEIRSSEIGIGYDKFHGLTISPNGKIIALTNTKDLIHLYDAGTLRFSQSLEIPVYSNVFERNMAWTPNSQWLAITDGAFLVFEQFSSENPSAAEVKSFDPDISGSKNTFVSNGQFVSSRPSGYFGMTVLPAFADIGRIPNAPTVPVSAVASTRDGALFAAASARVADFTIIRIYRADDGAVIAEIEAPLSRISELQFSPSGELLITANQARDIRVYRIQRF